MKPDFFKVFIVNESNRMVIRDCFKINEAYAYLRPLSSAGTEMPIAHCLSMTKDKYFTTLLDAENFIITRRQKQISVMEAEIISKQKTIENIKANLKEYPVEEYSNYDDRCNYEQYL